MEGHGNVVVVSDSGYVMKNRKAELRRRKKRRSFPIPLVMVISPESDTLWSIGFESKADLTHRVFYRPRIAFNRHLDLGQAEKSSAKIDTSAGIEAKRP